ncbi:MAG: hypothetical protein AAF704_03730 [Cyanobacteria bacterium P01_D01_bin.123]
MNFKIVAQSYENVTTENVTTENVTTENITTENITTVRTSLDIILQRCEGIGSYSSKDIACDLKQVG